MIDALLSLCKDDSWLITVIFGYLRSIVESRVCGTDTIEHYMLFKLEMESTFVIVHPNYHLLRVLHTGMALEGCILL